MASKIANRFWEKMAELYGSAWVKRFGKEPNDSWSQMLDQSHTMAIADSIKECTKKNPSPPSLPEFGAYLRTFNRIHREKEREQEQAKLPPKVMTKHEQEMARKAVKRAAPGDIVGNRRNVLFPDETYFDFQRKLAEAKNEGVSEVEFVKERLLRNGWTVEDERIYQGRLASLGLAVKYAPLVDIAK